MRFTKYIPLEKAGEDSFLGIASSTSIDRDEEKMSPNALSEMCQTINVDHANLFGNHQYDWENILGGIDAAQKKDDSIQIRMNPNKANPKYAQLIGTMATPGVKLGLSVGGNVKKSHWEHDNDLGKKIKIIDSVDLYEVSVVGIASNPDGIVNNVVTKSAKIRELNMGCAFPVPLTKCPACWHDDANEVCDMCLYRKEE